MNKRTEVIFNKLSHKIWRLINNNWGKSFGMDDQIIFSFYSCSTDSSLRKLMLVYLGYWLGQNEYIYSDEIGSKTGEHELKNEDEKAQDFIQKKLFKLKGIELRKQCLNMIKIFE